MQTTSATLAAPGRPNEDWHATGPDWAVVLDGASPRPGVDSGCVHDVPWLVRHLGSNLTARLSCTPQTTLVSLLRIAIRETRLAHGPQCDLDNPDSPSSTVTAVRRTPDGWEYLVLGDSPLVAEYDGEAPLTVIEDTRSGRLKDYTAEGVRAARNRPGGFWIASTFPGAAEYAVTGTLPAAGLHRLTLLTDGVTRFVERLALGDWRMLMRMLTDIGPTTVMEGIRYAEGERLPLESVESSGRRVKRHDDQTAVLVLP